MIQPYKPVQMGCKPIGVGIGKEGVLVFKTEAIGKIIIKSQPNGGLKSGSTVQTIVKAQTHATELPSLGSDSILVGVIISSTECC